MLYVLLSAAWQTDAIHLRQTPQVSRVTAGTVPSQIKHLLSQACACVATSPFYVALQILSHEINHGYKLGMLPMETFNNTPVQNLAHLAHLVDSSDDPYLNFGLDGGRFITLDRQQVRVVLGSDSEEGFNLQLLCVI